MKMTCTLPDHAAVVEALLEGFVRACQVCLESGLAPSDPAESNVRYQMEPRGEEDWKLPHNVVKDGWGDCEDLAGWRAAGMRMRGEDPAASVVVVKTGKGKLHAVVQRGDGSIDDPSAELQARQMSSMGAGAKMAVIHDKRQNAVAPDGTKYVMRRGDGALVYKVEMDPSTGRVKGQTAANDSVQASWDADVRRRQAMSTAYNKGADLTDPATGHSVRSTVTEDEFAFTPGEGWRRMNQSEQDDYDAYGKDPTGAYDLEQDDADEDQAEQEEQAAYQEAYSRQAYDDDEDDDDYPDNFGGGVWS